MLLIILGMLILQSASLGTILPLLAVYAFAGLRLLPAMQQIYQESHHRCASTSRR